MRQLLVETKDQIILLEHLALRAPMGCQEELETQSGTLIIREN